MLIVLVNYLLIAVDPHESLRVLLLNQSVLGSWAVLSVILQLLADHQKGKMAIPILWAVANSLMLTIAIAVNEAPRVSLSSGFVVLILATCFFRRVELVVAATTSALIGYLGLLIVFHEQESPLTPPSYRVMTGLAILIGGILSGLLANRMDQLSHREAVSPSNWKQP